MGIKISAMAADGTIGGAEIIPVSDSGAPKSVTTGGIKDYAIDSIEAIASGTAVTGADSVFILQGGVLKPVDIDLVAQHAIDTMWGNAAETVVDAADVLLLKDGGTTEKKVTAAILATYIRSVIVGSDITVAAVSAAGALAAADIFMVWQSGVGKKCTLTELNAAVLGGLDTYLAGLSAAAAAADADLIYTTQSGTEKKQTLSALKTYINAVLAPATTTENYIPQWTSSAKTLKDGLALRATVRASGTADDLSVPTEKGVVDAIADSVSRTGGDASGVVVQRFGATTTEGLETVVVDKTITLGAVAGVAVFTVPANSVLRSVQGNVQTAATGGGTTAAVGIGVDADPDAYGVSAALTLDSKINKLLTPTFSSATIAIEAFPCTAAGAIGNTAFTAGTLRVRIVYDRQTSLNNAS
jgi:hypothetical protein